MKRIAQILASIPGALLGGEPERKIEPFKIADFFRLNLMGSRSDGGSRPANIFVERNKYAPKGRGEFISAFPWNNPIVLRKGNGKIDTNELVRGGRRG